MDEAQAFVHHYQRQFLRKEEAFTVEDEKSLEAVTAKIDAQLHEFGDCGFVRLSSRSPKDAPLDNHPKAVEYLVEELSKFQVLDPNSKMIAIFNAVGRALKVHSGKEAMWLLLNSERVYSDLRVSIQTGEEHWDMKVFVREWKDFDFGMEFRGFVCKGKLTAFAQYNDLIFYPNLQGKEDELARKIGSFFDENISSRIPFDAYVCDFAVNGDEVFVIEINPFGPMTGMRLFDYAKERHILQGGIDLWGDLPIKDGYQPPALPVVRLVTEPNKALDDDFVNGTFSPLLKQLPQKEEEEKSEEPKRKNSKSCLVM